jgi:hypothetical protein
LRRSDLKAADSGDPVPVRTLEREVATTEDHGTIVEIEGIHLRSLDQAAVVHYVERHLAHWPKDVTVIVNNHQCEFAEPPVDRVVESEPPEPLRQVLGNAKLVVKVSKSPLDEDLRGVSIFAQRVWHETTLLTSRGKDMAEFIFGEIDVPALASDTSAPSPFDASRSMRLNPDNALVRAIFAFVGPRIEELRKELVEDQRTHRETEEAKRLRKEASQIEDIINRDFDSFRQRLQRVKAASAGTGPDASDTQEPSGGTGDDDFLFGGGESATVVSETGGDGTADGGNGGSEGPPRRLNPMIEPVEGGEVAGHYEGGKAGKPRRRGGFHIEFDSQGRDSARATYQTEKRTIYVNLDHPQIAAAKQGRSAEDPAFRRLAYEVAFIEYAMALASELDNRGEYIDPSDPIVDIRDTINRVAREAAPLYA